MRKNSILLMFALALATGAMAQKKNKKQKQPAPVAADTAKKAAPAAPAKTSIKDKVKSSKKIDGMFTLYQDTVTGSVQMYLRKDQLGKEYIYQSFSMGGPTALFLHQNMLRETFPFKVQKAYDKLEFMQLNTNFYYDKGNAVSKAANVDVSDAVFFAEKFTVEDSTGYLIPVDGLLLGDKLDQVKPTMPPTLPPGAVFNLGNLNPAKSKYGMVRSFPNNTDVLVELAYDNPNPLNRGGKDITDARFVRVKMQHSFLAMPENDYRARRDDPRVGYFGGQVDDLTSLSFTPYKDFISRWHLVKKDPSAAISEPVEPIVWWIENTTPVEFRQTIKEAGEKWNEAFEKAGFRNAVVMKIMPDDADWDPADIRYNVIRWVSSANPPYGAIGPSFFNPRTGQILGSDITVEWRSGAGTPNFDELFNGGISTAAVTMPWDNPAEAVKPPVTNGFDHKHLATCAMANELAIQFQTGLAAVEILDDAPANGKAAGEISEMHKQFLYYLIMHEMGHTLGLNHNMKASQMLSPEQIHDKEITSKIGSLGSVMDYPSINVNSNRAKQGDYYTTKAGPYDIWAIEYGYKPFSAAEEESALAAILSRSTDPQLAFGNDADDMRGSGGIDPRVMVNDNSNDMIAYAEDRFKLVNTMIPKLKSRFARPDQSWNELRTRYLMLQGQRSQMANAVSRYIGGVYVDRSYPGQKSKSNPFTVVPVEYQKKAMALLTKYLYSPNAFQADAQLFPYLQAQRRGFSFFGVGEDFKAQNVAQQVQMPSLGHILHPNTLARINNSSLYGNTYSVADVMGDLAKGIFSEDLKGNVNLYRQNLQTEFVKGAAAIVDAKAGYDNSSKAAALLTLKKVKTMLAGAVSTNEQTKAHRMNLVFMIDKALDPK